jgi:hypothetical protein
MINSYSISFIALVHGVRDKIQVFRAAQNAAQFKQCKINFNYNKLKIISNFGG